MDFMNPHYLWALMALPVFFGLWYRWGRRSHTLKNTQVSRMRASTTLGAVLTGFIWLSKAALWTSLCLALAGSFFSFAKLTTDSAGITYITVDTSGSTVMGGPNNRAEKILASSVDPRFHPDYKAPERPAPNPGGYMMDQKPEDTPRTAMHIDTELGVVHAIFNNSPGVRLGLTIFDDQMYYMYPATKEHGIVLSLLADIKRYSVEHSYSAGTNFEGPTGSNRHDGALQGAVNLFKSEPENAVRAYVMVTDGVASISDERMEQLVTIFKEQKIHFFLIGVGDSWKDMNATGNIQRIIEFAKRVDGFAQDEARFAEAMRRINDLARSSVRTVVIKERQDALLLLLAIAAISFAAWLSLSAVRRVSL
jgi:hypothetical protein